MNCPYCGKEMTQGFIQCRDGVYWTLNKLFTPALSIFGKDCTPLWNGAADNNRTVYAHKCSGCRKVIIDYSPSCKDFSTPEAPDGTWG